MDIGNAIRICRAHRGLTQSVLAKRAGISLSYLSLIEHNKRDPTVSSLGAIAEALGLPLNLLVFLGAGRSELTGVPDEVREKLSAVIMRILSENAESQVRLSL